MKGRHTAQGLSRSAPVAGASLRSALPCAKRLRAVGARTGRARQNGLRAGRWQGECFSIGVEPSGRDVLGQRASCPLRQRRDRTRLRIGGSRAGGRAGARPSRWSQQVATLPAREVPVGKWWRNGCEPRAAATRKMRIVPVRARRVRRLRPTKITPFMPSAHFAGAPVFPDTVSFPRRHRSSR